MTWSPPASLIRLRDHGLVLACLAALCAVGTTSAVAPPPPLPEAPAPGPLFNFDEIHVNPVHLSLAIFGSSADPLAGPYALLGGLYAGEQTRVFSFDGPMTNRYSRISVGASTLVLAGFNPSLASAALTQPGLLQAGQQLDCWALIDTDRFRALPRDWLSEVTDNQPIGIGGIEAEIYSRVLIRAHYTSTAAFRAHTRKDITFTHLFDQPARYRGTVVHVEGRLLRVNRFDPPHEAALAGVNDLYEAWIFPELIGVNPYCVIFTEWPAGLSRDLLGDPKIEGIVRVSFDGYFFKKYRYKANDPRGRQREAPLLIGHGLVYLSRSDTGANYATVPIHTMLWGFAVGFLVLLVGVFGLIFWYRSTDTRVRRRILNQMPEFALPPPDEPPMATPVSSSRSRSYAPTDQHVLSVPRFTFPAGLSDRGGGEGPASDKSGEGGGSKPSRKEKPPDEGAGA